MIVLIYIYTYDKAIKPCLIGVGEIIHGTNHVTEHKPIIGHS